MSFFKGVIGAFKDAVKAGNDFNPILEDTIAKLESLHSEGKLDEILFEAERSYKQEHEGYIAKGIHTDALDSQRDVRALSHFMDVLSKKKDTLDPELKAEAEKLIGLKDQMEHILGNIIKKSQE